MATKAFLLDAGRCLACEACVAACKTGNELPTGTQFISFNRVTTGTFPNLAAWANNHRCYHCTDAACVSVCPTGALYKEDGMTRLDCSKCIGCGYCTDACPFGVPVLVDGVSTKCDGCALATGAGGQPWCVKTCPTQSLLYGDREEILQEAKTRLAAIQHKYPNARIYGETEAGGLGVIMVLPDEPSALGLPENPSSPVTLQAWQKVVQPASVGLTSLSVAVAAVAAVISRRNHMRELKEYERTRALAGDDQGTTGPANASSPDNASSADNEIEEA